MSIDYLNNTGAIDGFNEHQAEQYSNEDLEAEKTILDYLETQHNVGTVQARAIIASLCRAGVNLMKLARGLIKNDQSAINQITVFIC